MNGVKKTISKYVIEASVLSIISIVFAILMLVANRFFDWHFSWEDIEFIDQPAILVRIFYSALAYISIGAILYKLGFYNILYQIFGNFLGNYRLYKKAKKVIWTGNILLMYFIIVPGIIHFLNFIISLFFNSYNFFLQSLPILGLSFGISWIILLCYFYTTKKEPLVFKDGKYEE